jgi:hypothetical protein
MMATRSVLTEKKLRRNINSSEPRPAKLTIRLSRSAKNNLEELRLRSLDKRGRMPSTSEIIEALLNTALENEKVPYPAP